MNICARWNIVANYYWMMRSALSIFWLYVIIIGKSACRDRSQMLPLFRHTYTHTLTLHIHFNQINWMTDWAMQCMYFIINWNNIDYFLCGHMFICFFSFNHLKQRRFFTLSVSKRTYQFANCFVVSFTFFRVFFILLLFIKTNLSMFLFDLSAIY